MVNFGISLSVNWVLLLNAVIDSKKCLEKAIINISVDRYDKRS